MNRLHNLVAAVALGSMVPHLATAQEPGNPLSEITVTGTRIITNTGMDTPTPVTAVSSEELTKMAPSSIIDALNQLPQFFGNIGEQQIIGGQNSGGANVNLRGAGPNRTLVLLDGRRVVASNRFGTVDVNMFPEPLLKRIETVTGGASASYGTDAVAGVVNFLLDTKFTGFKTHLQAGETTRWDGKNWKVDTAFGHAFFDRLHVVGSFQMSDLEPIDSSVSLQGRPYFNEAARVTDPNNPSRDLVRPYVAPTNFTNGGIIVEPSYPTLNRLQFLPDGTVQQFPFSGVGNLNAGCQCSASATPNYGVNSDREVQNAYRRYNGFLNVNYDLTDGLNLYVQGLHGMTRASQRRESISLLGIWQARIYADNAYLPASVVQRMQAALPANRQYFGFGFFGLNTPDTPLGETRQLTENHLDSGTIGFKSEFKNGILSGWRLNGYYEYGENRQDFITHNGIRVDRLPMAIDAVRDANGKIVCRVSLPQYDPNGIFKDCAPVDLFGGLQNLSPQAVNWIRDNGKIARQWTDEQDAELVLTGDLWKGFGAGPVGAAFGGAWRKDRLSQRTLDPAEEYPALPDGTLLSSLGIAPARLRGVVAQGSSGGVAGYNGIPGLRYVPAGFSGDSSSSSVLFSSLRAITGDYSVKEVFGELNIPLLKDVSWARSLDLSTSGRWASYSGSGTIWAWKFGASWSINDQVRLRATQSRDVRAATLQERFDQTRGGVNVQDPANGNAVVSTASFSGGNPNVNPESADTTTVGLVFQPSLITGFSTSVDWYSIDISDAIAQLSSQNVVTGCFNGDQTLCPYVHRANNAPNGLIERVDNLFINLANQRIKGMDLETTYRHHIRLIGGGPESIGWRFYATFLNENSIQNRGAPRDELAGQLGPGLPANSFALPKWKFTTNLSYDNGPFTAFVQGRWIGHGILDRTRVESPVPLVDASGKPILTIDDNHVPSTFYMDLSLSCSFGREENLYAYVDVTNLLDRAPVLTPSVVGRTGTVEFNSYIYDIVGRRVSVGLNYRF